VCVFRVFSCLQGTVSFRGGSQRLTVGPGPERKVCRGGCVILITVWEGASFFV
jgi:hypothetical protein